MWSSGAPIGIGASRLALASNSPMIRFQAVDDAVAWSVDTGDAEDRREPVVDVHDPIAGSSAMDVPGPAHDARCPQVPFAAREVRPLPVAGRATPQQHVLGAVVAREHDQRVVLD